MRPHRPTARTKSTGLARARMLLKSKLGWLSGYPAAEGWTVVPEQGDLDVERIDLDRNHLRRATYTANKLRSKFPRALPRLVGDADTWRAAVGAVLDQLKPWVHHGEPPPRSLYDVLPYSRTAHARVRVLRAEHPPLEGLVDALSWVLATRVAAAPKVLAWVEREAPALTVMIERLPPADAMACAIECCQVSQVVGPKAMRPMMALVALPALYEVALHGGTEYRQQCKPLMHYRGRAKRPKVPKPRFVEVLMRWARWLRAQERPVARRFLGLLGACALGPAAERWASWWPDVTTTATRAYHIHRRDEAAWKVDRLAPLAKVMERAEKTQPPQIDLRGLTAALQSLARVGSSAELSGMERVLLQLREPELAGLRAGLLVQWEHVSTYEAPWWDRRRLTSLLRHMADYLRATDDVRAAMAPWWSDMQGAASTGAWQHSVDLSLLDAEDLEPADVGRFFEVLRWLRDSDSSIDLGEISSAVVRLLEAFHDAALCGPLAEDLLESDMHERWLSADVLRAAWQVAEPDVVAFADLADAFEQVEHETELSPGALLDALLPAMGDERAVLRILLLDKDLGALLECGRTLAVLRSLGHPLRVTARAGGASGGWIAEYPEVLRDDLVWLSGQTPKAEAIAARVLRSIRHDPAALEAERAAVEQQLASATAKRAEALRARLATLAGRVGQRPTLSDAKLERLRTKLRRRGGLEHLREVTAAAEAALPEAVGETMGLRPVPAWALEERVLRLLVPLRSESASTRRLARALFVARAGPPPWDLREHPANAAFLEALRGEGIDPDPWLDDWETTAGGLRLRLEDDPLEVFHMGRHFGTCLSPGHCNFFSVFTNAADVNKRVLYARDAKGQVQGRRLICLTGGGSILAFEAYCHDKATSFEKHSTALIRELARAMKTVLVTRGTVPTLVASRWYDDGPVDVAGQFDPLGEDSEFRRALRGVRVEALAGLFARTFGRSQIDEGIAPMLLALPELDARPDLVVTLLSLVRHPERLPLRTCLEAGQRLAQAGASHRARDLFAEPIARALEQQHREHEWMDSAVLDYLAKLDPSRALRLLRQTRGRGVRRWDDESDAERLLVAGTAMQALRRPQQAIRLFRLAEGADGLALYKNEARTLREALEAPPG